jgi:phosphatidylglycerophosphatase C
LKRIAFFDFDGTITSRDTMFELIKFQKGMPRFLLGVLCNMPVFAALKLKLISNQVAKERLLSYFFGGTTLADFQSGCDQFAENKLPSLIRPASIEEIEKLKAEGFEVVVVSASAENWIKKWAGKTGVKLIATRLQSSGDKITGRIAGINCNHAEKAARIKADYNLSGYDEIYGYGDSSGDHEMLALTTKTFYQPFRG